MDKSIYYIILAVIITALIPLVPLIIRVRIAVLRFIRWKWFADFHENHFDRLVIIVRSFLALLAVYLFYLGFSG